MRSFFVTGVTGIFISLAGLGCAHHEASEQSPPQVTAPRPAPTAAQAAAPAATEDRSIIIRFTPKPSLAQRLGEAGIGNVRREGNATVLSMSGDVLFQTDQATLSDTAKKNLDVLAHALEQTPPTEPVKVEGYADSRGTAEHNLDLSKRRAAAVQDYLISQGVDSKLIASDGFGEDNPVADNSSPEGRANNRRVEIVLAEVPAGVGGAGPQQ